MTTSREQMLERYADLAIEVGLNLRAGQRLLIIGPLAYGGVSLEAAPLVRHVTKRAYAAGASLVEALWGDEALLLARFQNAPRDSFREFSSWLAGAVTKHAAEGHAVLQIHANDPDLLAEQPPELVAEVQRSVAQNIRPFREHISRNDTNWSVIAAPGEKWAARVFPGAPPAEQVDRLWDAIARMCRLDHPSPVQAWRAHIEALAARRDYLNGRRYVTLKYRGPGTDLSIGLPDGHLWVSARSKNRAGIDFTANLPTEEVFTMPHRERVEGIVAGSKPLSYAGTLIDRFHVTFAAGRVVEVKAEQGESALRSLVATDEGAGRLGEVALVSHDSPIAQSGILFYNTLFDENAASHVALGSAYKFTIEGGDAMSNDAFSGAGGNQSATHVDFMIGSPELDVDGVRADGAIEPIMRRGVWAFELSK